MGMTTRAHGGSMGVWWAIKNASYRKYKNARCRKHGDREVEGG